MASSSITMEIEFLHFESLASCFPAPWPWLLKLLTISLLMKLEIKSQTGKWLPAVSLFEEVCHNPCIRDAVQQVGKPPLHLLLEISSPAPGDLFLEISSPAPGDLFTSSLRSLHLLMTNMTFSLSPPSHTDSWVFVIPSERPDLQLQPPEFQVAIKSTHLVGCLCALWWVESKCMHAQATPTQTTSVACYQPNQRCALLW